MCYRTIQYPILLYCTVSYCVVPYCMVLYYTVLLFQSLLLLWKQLYVLYVHIWVQQCTVPYHTVPDHIVPYPTVLCSMQPESIWENVSYRITSYCTVPYRVYPVSYICLITACVSLIYVWSIPLILSVLSSAPTSTQCLQSCNLNRTKRHCMEMFLHTATSGWLFICWYFEAIKGSDFSTPHIKKVSKLKCRNNQNNIKSTSCLSM